MRRTNRTMAGLAALLTTLVMVAAACAPDWAPHGSDSTVRYVSLGDSWVSGPLIWPQTGEPIDCGRSTRNFAALLAKRLDVKWFRDASCGGADIKDLWSPSEAELGSHVAPQFTALKPDTTLVTIGIGGNDASIADSAIHCVNILQIPLGPAPFGRPCVEDLTKDGKDELGDKIEKVRPKMAAVLAEIHRRSPRARVYVLGYGKAFPEGDGCWPYAPVLPPVLGGLAAQVHPLRLHVEPHHPQARRPDLQVGGDIAFPVDSHFPRVPVRPDVASTLANRRASM